MDAPIESSNEFINRVAALARALSNHGNTCEHIFDAVIELGHQDVLMLLRPLTLRNVKSEASDPYKTPYGIELGS